MQSKLSVITINFNHARGLEKTILSIIGQIEVAFEYIVIDGGSTDGSVEILEKYREKISMIVSEPDNGIYHAMNKGIALSKGEYLLFINSGDELNGDRVLKSALSNFDDSDLIYFDLMIVSGNSETLREYPNKPTFKYFLTDSLPHPATFIRRKLFDKTNGYDETLKISADWAFFLIALFKYEVNYKHVSIPLAKFYTDGISSVITNKGWILEEQNKVLKQHFKSYYDLIEEWREVKRYRFIFENSRLIKIAKKLGFLKLPPDLPF